MKHISLGRTTEYQIDLRKDEILPSTPDKDLLIKDLLNELEDSGLIISNLHPTNYAPFITKTYKLTERGGKVLEISEQ